MNSWPMPHPQADQTPLMCASAHGAVVVVKALLAAGANKELRAAVSWPCPFLGQDRTRAAANQQGGGGFACRGAGVCSAHGQL